MDDSLDQIAHQYFSINITFLLPKLKVKSMFHNKSNFQMETKIQVMLELELLLGLPFLTFFL